MRNFSPWSHLPLIMGHYIVRQSRMSLLVSGEQINVYAHEEEAISAPACSSRLKGREASAHPAATTHYYQSKPCSLPRVGGGAQLDAPDLLYPARTRAACE